MTDDRPPAGSTRARILRAAEALLAEGGPDAVGTREVSAAAGVQAPAIYRAFGDERGLLDAVARAGFDRYLQGPGVPEGVDDPLEDLRAGWDQHIGLALANPDLDALVYGDPTRLESSPTAAAAARVVAEKVHRLAGAGRLRTSEERAVQLLLAVGSGTALALMGTPVERRDPSLSVTAREACVSALTGEGPPAMGPGRAGAAAALRADLDTAPGLSAGERLLLGELLDRLARGAHEG